MTRRAAATLAILLGITGCGGSGSITPATYRAKVNKLCATGNAQIEALPANSVNSIAGIERLDAIANATLRRIKTITPPSSISSAVHTWLGTLDRASSDTGQIITALRAGQTTQAATLGGQVAAVNPQSNTEAKAAGLDSCASDAIPRGS